MILALLALALVIPLGLDLYIRSRRVIRSPGKRWRSDGASSTIGACREIGRSRAPRATTRTVRSQTAGGWQSACSEGLVAAAPRP